MREVTEADERAVGVLAWICDRCKHEEQTLPDYPEPTRRRLRIAGNPSPHAAHASDPRLGMIRLRRRRWEVRIWMARPDQGPPPGTGGRGRGVRLRLGLYPTLEAAIAARDIILAQLGSTRQVRWQRA